MMKPEMTSAHKSTVNLRGGSNRRNTMTHSQRKEKAKKKIEEDFESLGLSGAKYTPVFN